ncbi:MAG: aminotransferase class V-fold PLP-dependent enzyme [Candidatus Micrarchaeia archaeon]
MNGMDAYLDNSATTRVDPLVVEAMLPFFTERFGNPSSIHSKGAEAREAVEVAREQVARLIGAKPSEIIFTSGGTESDNLAIIGAARQLHLTESAKNAVVCSNVEHPAVLNTCKDLAAVGYSFSEVKVNSLGIIELAEAQKHVSSRTAVASIMLANNEIGTIQPVTAVAKLCHESGALMHTDAVQAVGKIPIDVRKLEVDLLSLASHKFHGPKGMGALYIREGVKIKPIFGGGGHERGLRSGTENVPGIVGLGKAAEIARENLSADIEKMGKLRDRLIDGLSVLPRAFLNGDRHQRLPNNVNYRFLGVEGEALITLLDGGGVCASTGSACSSKKLKASHVLTALGLADWEAHGSLRLTLSRFTTKSEVDYALEKIPQAVNTLRRMSPVWAKLERGEKIEDVKDGQHVH